MIIGTAVGPPNPRRLLLLSSEFPPGPGGIGTHAFQLARHLTRLNWTVQVLSPQPYVSVTERADFNRRQPFSILSLPERERGRFWWAERVRMVASALRAFKPDVLLATGRRSLWMASGIQSLSNSPWVAIGHGSEFQNRNRGTEWLTRRAIGRAELVIAVSDYTAGLIRHIATPRRLVVIPNAADGDRFRPGLDTSELRRAWDIQKQPVLLTVGQVSERKAQDIIIRAMPNILAVFPDTQYIMAGLPSRESEFWRLAVELGVQDHVRFAGMIADDVLPQVYNLADLFVLVSRRTVDGDVEGYGIVVQEAALCGVPAVVSRDCGLTEAILEGTTGLSVPPNDPAATAAAIIDLLGNSKRRIEMGRCAREQALTATWAERAAEYD